MDSLDDHLTLEEEAFLLQLEEFSGEDAKVAIDAVSDDVWCQYDDFELKYAAEIEEQHDRYLEGLKTDLEENEENKEDEENTRLGDDFDRFQSKYDELGYLSNAEWIAFVKTSQKLRASASGSSAKWYEIRTAYLDFDDSY